MSQGDRMTVFWGMRSDITAGKRVMEALEERIRTIDALYEHVLQAGKATAITQHTAQVAHELRQPLAIIGGFARRLEKEAAFADNISADSLRESTRIMIREIRRLEEILGGLIDYTRRERVQPTGINPNETIRYVIDINRPRLEEKMLHVETSFGDDVDEIFVDADRFQQVIRNLLANSIEASTFGNLIRIETGVSTLRDNPNLTLDGDAETYFEMKIHNYGRAISPENIRKIFDPFFTTKHYGTGIGLTLSRKIVEDHGGSMSVKSGEEEGTTFTVWLPLDEAKERAGAPRDRSSRIEPTGTSP